MVILLVYKHLFFRMISNWKPLMTYLTFFGNNEIYWAHYFKDTILLKVSGKVEDVIELQTLLIKTIHRASIFFKQICFGY